MVEREHPINKTTLDRVAKAMYYASLKSRDWEKLATDIKDYWLGEAETAITVYDEILLEDENTWKEDYSNWELGRGEVETAFSVTDEILLEDENAWKEDYPSWELNPGKSYAAAAAAASSKVWKDDERAMKRRWIRHL